MKAPGDDEVDEERGRQPDDKEVIEHQGFLLPPILLRDDDPETTTTHQRIAFIYVFKKQPSKQLAYLDWRPADQLNDLGDLLEQFGAGTYTLQGRGEDRRTTLRNHTVVVGSEHGELPHNARAALERTGREQMDFTKIVSGVVAAAAPLLAMVTGVLDKREQQRREDREREEQRRREDRERDDARNERFMQTMTSLMSARNQDLEGLVRGLQEQRAQATAPAGSRERQAYEDGLASALEMIRTAKEEGLGGDDFETKMLGLVEAFAVGQNKAHGDVAAAVRPPTEDNGAS